MKLKMQLIINVVIFGTLLINLPVARSISISNSLLKQGIIEKAAGNQNGAIELFDSALRQTPNLVNAYIERGDAKQRAGKYQSAILDFDRAIKLNPSSRNAYWARANTKLRLRQTAAALADYQQVRTLAQKEGDLETIKDMNEQIEHIQTWMAIATVFAALLLISLTSGGVIIFRHYQKIKPTFR